MSVYREFYAEKINLDEFLTAVYTQALSSYGRLYEHQGLPEKPLELRIAEGRFRESGDNEDAGKRWEFHKTCHQKFPGYFEALKNNASVNKSSAYFMREIRDYFEGRNPALSQLAQAILSTHGDFWETT